MHPHILGDRFLHAHAKWYLREVRIKAYAQFLESYKSVTASSMASSFGVGVEFLDRELARFIAAGRIHAKIDKVRDGACVSVSPTLRISPRLCSVDPASASGWCVCADGRHHRDQPT